MNDFVLYSYFRSSTSHRVRITLNLKQIAYTYEAVDRIQRDAKSQDALLKVNPSGRVPCLVHRGTPISQSMAIVQYLDRICPEPRLFPDDPKAYALTMAICELVNSDIAPLHGIDVMRGLGDRFNADESMQHQWAAHWIAEGFKSLEALLKPSAGTYSFGSSISGADVFVVPAIYRAHRFGVDMTPFPALMGVARECAKLEAFQRAAPEQQPDASHAGLHQLHIARETLVAFR